MPAIATYPGTVTPLRGLSAFAESERDVLFGRDRDRDELARLVTADSFRAGLVYGEPGVGKTSLLRAGLVPHLRDHGVVALVCEDINNPVESFATAVSRASGVAPTEGERPIAFLSRVVSQSMEGQLYLFILDEVDRVLATGDDRIVNDVGDMFARVVTRSGGRARFLFSCASSEVHLFGLLERRTGSLFPPSSRYVLERFQPQEAALVLDRTLALAGIPADPQLASTITETLARDGAILPADIQIAALAVHEMGITSVEQIGRLGGAGELERLWITSAAAATGAERTALRLVAELAIPRPGTHTGGWSAEWAATRASIDPTLAHGYLSALAERGVVRVVASDTPVPHYELAHPILGPRIREVAAPARAAARRAFELLGSKAAEAKRLSLREWYEVRREGLVPATPSEQAVLQKTKRFYTIIGGAILATPLVILLLIWMSISGSYYLDVEGPAGDGTQHVVVRAGKPALTGFNWLPGSPSYGSVVADTGFTRAMIDDAAWNQIRAHDLGGDLDSGYSDQAIAALAPSVRGLLAYGTTNDPKALDALASSAEGPDELVPLLESLRPVANGNEAEVAFVAQQLRASSPAVRNAALALAQDATARGSSAYHATLAKLLASADTEERRSAFSAAQALDAEVSRKLFELALEQEPEAAARRELLAFVTADSAAEAPSPETAKSVLVNSEIAQSTRDKARGILRRAFTTDPKGAATAAAGLAADAKAPDAERVFALRLLFDDAPAETYEDILDDVRSAKRAKSEVVRAAALPLYARVAPKDAAGDLVIILDDKKASPAMREAMTLAWGELAKDKDGSAQGALEGLIKDPSSSIRAAAARAYGNVGRISQSELIKMVKSEGLGVAVGAAYGLANSAENGGPTGNAVSGIGQLWKRKGRSRREAAEVYARMAKNAKNARFVYSYLSSAANSKDDASLHPIGAEGLCNAMAAGYRNAQSALVRVARDESVEVRRIVINCVSDHPDVKIAPQVAGDLADDPSVDVRTEAARVLAQLAATDKPPASVGTSLTKMIGDESRDVRIIALRAMAKMGDKTPKDAAAALVKAFDRADEGEKLELLAAARAIGAAELVPLAMSDGSPTVRISAIDTAIATGTEVATSINAALTDDDPGVRRAALERLAREKAQLDQPAVDRALAIAVRDEDPAISAVALASFARIGDTERVKARLLAALASRSERERARGAAAAIGLVERGDANSAVALLEPLITDPSHDVRVAMLPAMAAAYAATNSPDQLAKMLRGAERNAMRRLVAAAAFVVLARTDAGNQAAKAGLAEIADKGSPMVRTTAKLARGLIEGNADGLGFLAQMVP
ncbi:MAG TPA: AAA family ATPase [Kofleriaceae bacterium]|nr:AAA family ATPase [Kofleriaceae bacterium]